MCQIFDKKEKEGHKIYPRNFILSQVLVIAYCLYFVSTNWTFVMFNVQKCLNLGEWSWHFTLEKMYDVVGKGVLIIYLANIEWKTPKCVFIFVQGHWQYFCMCFFFCPLFSSILENPRSRQNRIVKTTILHLILIFFPSLVFFFTWSKK